MADTPSNSAPTNYNGDQTIYMYPTGVFESTFYVKSSETLPSDVYTAGTTDDGYAYGTVPSMLRSVSSSFQTIYDIWNGLKLSWIGDSADAAQLLQSELDRIQNRLFGMKDDDTKPGVIEQMSSVAANASALYSNVEETNTKMFNDFADAITWTPLPDENATPDSTPTDKPSNDSYTFAPISEKF
jgi:hypothetical protein